MTARQVAFVSSAALALFAAPPAHAYLDPGTGSMILQGIIGVVAGGLVVLKLYWSKVKLFFSAKSATEPTEDDRSDRN